jgi:hypothetical protein
LEIRIKVEEEDEKPEKIQKLLSNGLKGKYILQSIVQDTKNREYIFHYKKRA